MIILDTDHITVLMFGRGAEFSTLSSRMASTSHESFATSVISVEETTRGWLARLKRAKSLHDQIDSYDRLIEAVRFYGGWSMASFSASAATIFHSLRKQKIRIGTMELKIASIALAEGALLLSANIGDFQRVPKLRVED